MLLISIALSSYLLLAAWHYTTSS